jgi:hypothetical protein
MPLQFKVQKEINAGFFGSCRISEASRDARDVHEFVCCAACVKSEPRYICVLFRTQAAGNDDVTL